MDIKIKKLQKKSLFKDIIFPIILLVVVALYGLSLELSKANVPVPYIIFYFVILLVLLLILALNIKNYKKPDVLYTVVKNIDSYEIMNK